eukprot:5581186-Amphidinium_carterae.2
MRHDHTWWHTFESYFVTFGADRDWIEVTSRWGALFWLAWTERRQRRQQPERKSPSVISRIEMAIERSLEEEAAHDE